MAARAKLLSRRRLKRRSQRLTSGPLALLLFFSSNAAHATLCLSKTYVNFINVSVRSFNSDFVSISNCGRENETGVDANYMGSMDFMVYDNCPSELRPGQSCTVNISFSPYAEGQYNGTIVVRSNSSYSSVVVRGNAVEQRFGQQPLSDDEERKLESLGESE